MSDLSLHGRSARKNVGGRVEGVIFAAESVSRLIREQLRSETFFGSFLVTKKEHLFSVAKRKNNETCNYRVRS